VLKCRTQGETECRHFGKRLSYHLGIDTRKVNSSFSIFIATIGFVFVIALVGGNWVTTITEELFFLLSSCHMLSFATLNERAAAPVSIAKVSADFTLRIPNDPFRL
jgi:hypothetical protein